MFKRTIVIALLFVSTTLLVDTTPFGGTALFGGTAACADENRVDFAKDVFPILQTYCIGCHTADDPQGGLVMDDFRSLIKGGESGVALTAGEPGSSRMLLMIQGKLEPAMPPEGAERPSEAERETLTRWVEQGASGPDGDMPLKRELRIPKITPAQDVDHPITAIAVSKDGRRTAKARFAAVVIESTDGKPVEIKDPDLGKINSIEFSADGERLLIASGLTGAYGRAAIFDTHSGRLLKEFVGHRDVLYAAVFAPDQSIIATAGYDRKIVLWDIETGEIKRELLGHNGAIFDLAFSPDGKVLASACADETVKVWNVDQGTRLDTLSQPEGEVYCVAFTRDGNQLIASSEDNRIRVWKLRSIDSPRINPLTATRFVDETPVTQFEISPDNKLLVAVAESGNIKLIGTRDWQPIGSLAPLGESASDLLVSRDGRSAKVALMNGEIVQREIPSELVASLAVESSGQSNDALGSVRPILMDLGEPKTLKETDLRQQLSTTVKQAETEGIIYDVDRNVVLEGSIGTPAEVDLYRWNAKQGEVWAIDADAVSASRLDPIVSVLDATGQPVLRTRLQAVRDSYFTFRGKDSKQFNDFRVFNWQEMNLGEYLYAAGEVTRLHMHPRGPDSGFNVYPGKGNRWTYFGTSGTTHALGEPAYIVRALPPQTSPLANGLPTFDIVYENDDDPHRRAGKNSRLLFTAPADGLYTVRIMDTRGEGGEAYGYRLAIRAATPGFSPIVGKISRPLKAGTGREFELAVDRLDGYDGPVTFEIDGLPDRLVSNFPVTIEAGQRFATAMVWADSNEKGWEGDIQPTVTAHALIGEKRVERSGGSIGKLTFDPKPAQVIPTITPVGTNVGPYEAWTLQVRRGQTVSARVSIARQADFKNEVPFGKEFSGRNASQGVYVDNIGLNGLLILAGSSEREFFVTADPTAKPGKRSFFLTAGVDGGLTSHPIFVEVLP